MRVRVEKVKKGCGQEEEVSETWMRKADKLDVYGLVSCTK